MSRTTERITSYQFLQHSWSFYNFISVEHHLLYLTVTSPSFPYKHTGFSSGWQQPLLIPPTFSSLSFMTKLNVAPICATTSLALVFPILTFLKSVHSGFSLTVILKLNASELYVSHLLLLAIQNSLTILILIVTRSTVYLSSLKSPFLEISMFTTAFGFFRIAQIHQVNKPLTLLYSVT